MQNLFVAVVMTISFQKMLPWKPGGLGGSGILEEDLTSTEAAAAHVSFPNQTKQS